MGGRGLHWQCLFFTSGESDVVPACPSTRAGRRPARPVLGRGRLWHRADPVTPPVASRPATAPGATRRHPRHAAAAGRRACSTNVRRGATDVPVDHRVQVTAAERPPHLGRRQLAVRLGRRADVRPTGTSWTAGGAARAQHVVHRGHLGAVRRRQDGHPAPPASAPQPLTLDQQTYPSFAPLSGQTVGVGMPVIVKFDVPVTDRASIEKNLHVVSQPAQKGSWHWLSDNEVHWRPAHYWKARHRRSPSTPTSTVSRPATASTASSTARPPSTSAPRTSTRSTSRPTSCRSSTTAT